MNFIITGPPGCGKGTQAKCLANRFQCVHISTGDMLRAAVRSGSEIGKMAESIMSNGNLIPDKLMITIIGERLQEDDAKKGWLLDGFPRTVAQAEALVALLIQANQTVNAVITLEVPDDEIIRRITGRLICGHCGQTPNCVMQPGCDNRICPHCGTQALRTRSDDLGDTINARLQCYWNETYPAITKLGDKFPLYKVDGVGDPLTIGKRITDILHVLTSERTPDTHL